MNTTIFRTKVGENEKISDVSDLVKKQIMTLKQKTSRVNISLLLVIINLQVIYLMENKIKQIQLVEICNLNTKFTA